MENKERTEENCLTPSRGARIKNLLKKLGDFNVLETRKYFSRINKEEADCLTEVFLNILYDCIPLSYTQVKQLFRHRITLRKLAKKGISLKQKRKFFQTIPALHILKIVTPKVLDYLDPQ